MRGVKVRKSDGLLHDVLGGNVMLACGGIEGNLEMLAKYIGNCTADLPLIAPGLVHNKGAGLEMALEVGVALEGGVALEVGVGTAGSFNGMRCELADTRAGKPEAVIWGHNYRIVVNSSCKHFYDEGERYLFATFEMIALETWRDQNWRAYFVTDKSIMDRFRPGWPPTRSVSKQTPSLSSQKGWDSLQMSLRTQLRSSMLPATRMSLTS
jgi:hypothetical protein